MRSGCDSALLFDSLRQLGRQGEYKRFEGKCALVARIGTAVSSVAGGLLAMVFLRLPFLVNVASALFMPAVALSLAEPEREPRRSKNPLLDILRICRYCLQQPHIRPVILSCGLLMACQLTALWAYFLLYQELGIGVGWFGVLFAVFQLAGALGGARLARVQRALRGQDRPVPGAAQPGFLHPARPAAERCGCCPWCRPTPCSGTWPTRCCSSA